MFVTRGSDFSSNVTRDVYPKSVVRIAYIFDQFSIILKILDADYWSASQCSLLCHVQRPFFNEKLSLKSHHLIQHVCGQVASSHLQMTVLSES